MPALKDWDNYERSTNIAHAAIEGENDHFLYISINEFYVGLHESSGGKGLRTTRYEFHMADDDEDGIDVRFTITPLQMITVGQQILNCGIYKLQEQLTAIAAVIDQGETDG